MGRILVFCETTTAGLSPGSREQISAARQLGDGTGWSLDLVMAGSDNAVAAEEAGRSGADRVVVVDDARFDHPWPEAVAELLADLCDALEPGAIVMPRSVLGAEVSARLAARLGVGMAMDAMSLEPDDRGLVVTRPVHGGAATARLRLLRKPWIVVPRRGVFPPVAPIEVESAERMTYRFDPDSRGLRTTVVSHEAHPRSGPDLERARVIVAGGRGLGGPEPFRVLAEIAARLDGAVAASRPPCDAGWVEPTLQVGLTGKTVAPELYMAVGISGATQHMTGCSLSRVVVAINSDPAAPIFRMATFGVVGDWQQVLPGFLAGLTDTSSPEDFS